VTFKGPLKAVHRAAARAGVPLNKCVRDLDLIVCRVPCRARAKLQSMPGLVRRRFAVDWTEARVKTRKEAKPGDVLKVNVTNCPY